jgi:hypothetical protein
MFHLTEKEVIRLHEQFHELAQEAVQAGNFARAVILQEAAKLVHDARMDAYDRRSATANRRRQRQSQGATR